MTNQRIKKLAKFLYSSNSSNDVPLRISIITGMCGYDLTEKDFCILMLILENSTDIKTDLRDFINSIA